MLKVIKVVGIIYYTLKPSQKTQKTTTNTMFYFHLSLEYQNKYEIIQESIVSTGEDV